MKHTVSTHISRHAVYMPSAATYTVHKRNTAICMRRSYFASDWRRLLCDDMKTRHAGFLCGGINGTTIGLRDAGIVFVGITGILKRVCWCS